jgi:S1-C subfamily serine protease
MVSVGMIALGGCFALGWFSVRGTSIKAQSPTAPEVSVGPVTAPATVVEIEKAFESVAQAVRPAVVSISSRKEISPSNTPETGVLGGDNSPRVATGTGSGFIVRKDGYILTNDHVVEGASQVTVRLQDGREYIGDVKRDPKSDLAIVKINADNLPTLTLTDSKNTKVGQWAIAFGSPFSLNDTMTVGVVSAVGREELIRGGGTGTPRFYPNLLQTDASINPGNSGGPLVDIHGSVIGVNVAINSPNGGSVGIGFAIPANSARYVMEELIARGSVTRGFLGLTPQNLTPDDQGRYGAKEGALVTSIQNNTPAARSGLLVEDIITRLDDLPIRNELELREAIARTPPGKSISLSVMREKHEEKITATVEAVPQERITQTPPTPSATPGRLGVQVTPASPDTSTPGGSSNAGVQVTAVEPASSAAEAGVRTGDVILRINGKPLRDPQDLTAAVLATPPGQSVALVVRRSDGNVLLRAPIH